MKYATEDFKKLSGLLEEAGYKLDFSQDVFARFKSSSGAYLMDLDFMFVDEETFNKIVKDGTKVSIAKQEVIVPSLNNLIALKLHSLKHNPRARETRDLPEIVDLVRANKVDFKSGDFGDLCLKYGTEDIYQKIVEGA